MKNTLFQFLYLLYFQNYNLAAFCSTSFFTLWRGPFHLYPFWTKNLLMLISLISRSLNCAFRSVAIFVALKKGLPAKCSKIKHSFSSSMIFFLPDPGWRLMSPVSFSCLLFLLIVLSERPRVSNCAIFEIDIPIWFRVENSWSFCFILDLADHVCLLHLDVCLCLILPSPSIG